MMDRFNDLPYFWVFLLFWCGAVVRSNMFYWIGRGVSAGTAHSRWAAMLDSPMYLTAQAWSARWGILAVPLSFFTVGLQSVIQFSAGVSQMRLRRYVPATMVGAVGWATVYTTIGIAVFAAWLASPAGRVVSILLLAGFIASVVWQHRRVKRAADLSRSQNTDGA